MVTPKPPRPFRGMRRLTLTGAGTATVLVLLFSYRTSTGESGTDTPQALAPAQVVSGVPSADDPTTPAGGDTSTTTQDSGGTAGSAGPTTTEQSTTERSKASTPATAAAGSTTTPTAPTTSSASSTSSGSVTVDGSQEMTRYGVVQVEVTITDGHITDVAAVQYPNRERRDIEINDQALPLLRSEVLAAQSANVDAISGATYTSEGYLTSLQAALDAAGFKS